MYLNLITYKKKNKKYNNSRNNFELPCISFLPHSHKAGSLNLLMKKIATLTLAIVAIATFPSCSNRLADLTVATTKNMDINNGSGYVVKNNTRTKGEDMRHIVLFFPLGRPDIKESIDDAVEKNGEKCVGLSNVTLTEKFWYIPFIYGQVKFETEGDPIFSK